MIAGLNDYNCKLLQLIFIGHYALYGRIKPRNLFVTARLDIDLVTDFEGEGHIVTVHMGRGNNEGMINVDLPT